VMYVRNLSNGQVPWSCIYAVIQGSCNKHACKESFRQTDTLDFYLHIHTYEQPFTHSHNLKLLLHTHNGECLFTRDVCKKSVKQVPWSYVYTL